MKRSNEPIFWAMFGAGGMLAALIGPALVLITGIAVPLGLIFAPDTMSYAYMQSFARHWLGKAFLFAVVSLFLWHAVHRIAILMHDFGVHAKTAVKLICYGGALLGTIVAGYSLLKIGF